MRSVCKVVPVALLLALLGCGDMKPGKPSGPKVYTREEFRKVALGQSLDGVRAAIGAPDRIEAQDYYSWVYYSRTTNPKTGKVDARVELRHKDDRVRQVSFYVGKKDQRPDRD